MKMSLTHEDYRKEKGIGILDDINRIFKELKNNLSELQTRSERIDYESSNRNYGVLSMSIIWYSILMWSHYTDNHKGYCIGFHWDKLQKHSQSFRGGLVNYTHEYPQVDPLEEDLIETIWKKWQYKASDWEYEHEYRIVKGLFMGDDNRVLEFPDDYIAEIVLGMKMNHSDRVEILAIAKSKDIPVFQTKSVPFKFKLDRERLI